MRTGGVESSSWMRESISSYSVFCSPSVGFIVASA